MVISHKNKFLYISPPKCASTTLRILLRPYSDICSLEYSGGKSKPGTFYRKHHTNAQELKQYFDEQEWDWDTYFKFTFARNPWSRVVSRYFYARKMGFISKSQSFEDYVTWVVKCKNGNSVSDFISDDDGNNMIDYVGKIENMEQNFRYVCSKIGLDIPDIKHINNTKHKPYIEYYNNKMKKLVAEKYAKDIERFNYEFGD
jgi:hypothetical protein